MRNSRVEVQPIAGGCGAEIGGVDIADDLDGGVIAEIRQALNQHCVIFFRDQEFDAAQQKAFARRFSTIFVHPNYKGMQADDEIQMIFREPGDKHIVGEDWHADTTMMPEPPMGAILYALEVPPYGGDTLFSSQYRAYETLSDGMKKMLAGLRAVHSDRLVAGPVGSRNQYRATKVRGDDSWRETISLHPVVRTHPETGRKALYVSTRHTIRFKGWTEEESRPVIQFLQTHCTRPEFTARIRWEKGTVTIWDNRCCQHFAINDYHGQRRVMWRLPVGAEAVG
jgi:taurine dioxygenase